MSLFSRLPRSIAIGGLGIGIGLGIGTVTLAEIYRPPPDLLAERIANGKIYRNNPANPAAIFEYAISCIDTGKMEKGLDLLKKIATFDPNYATKAIQQYSDTIANDPRDWMVYFKLALAYYANDQQPEADTCLQNVNVIDPNNVWAIGLRAFLANQTNHISDGIALCNQALQIEPNATEIHGILSALLYKSGDYSGALAHSLTANRLRSLEIGTTKNPNRFRDE